MKLSEIKIEDYNFSLPDKRIAKFPLPERDKSKLLFMHKSEIKEYRFDEIPNLLPPDTLLLFNETKVIQARLIFKKSTGAHIEIFCLEPVLPVNDFQLAFGQRPPVVWKCLVGNARRWKVGILSMSILIGKRKVTLFAKKKKRLNDAFLIEFSWQPDEFSFFELLEMSGLTPLPPYLHRQAEMSDKERYQTIYARFEGSVAAPTAGLHFTDTVMQNLKLKNIDFAKMILHVGAGTFKPVSAKTIGAHKMHTEKIKVSKLNLEKIYNSLNKKIIPVGTTSMRSLESLFWMGLKLELDMNDFNFVEQWDAYNLKIPPKFDAKKALRNVIFYLNNQNLEWLQGATEMIIVPGYKFRFANGLITNFHQPKSTLLLLVSALVGEHWKNAYNFALSNNFRFLSYGDSCLFLPL